MEKFIDDIILKPSQLLGNFVAMYVGQMIPENARATRETRQVHAPYCTQVRIPFFSVITNLSTERGHEDAQQ